MRPDHAFAEEVVLDGAQGLAHLALNIGACRAEDEVHRDLREAEFGEVVVERGARAILHDAAQRVHLHVFAGLGVLAPHQLQLAVHHLDQRIGGIGDAQRRLALNVAGQDDIVMRDPRQGEAAHRAPLAGADGGGGTQRHRGQEAQHALELFDDDAALGDAFEAEEADLAEAGVEVGQDVDGLRHLGQRIAASVKGIADEGHGKLRRLGGVRKRRGPRRLRCAKRQTPSRAMMPTAASWPSLVVILAPSSTVAS